jgi:ketosteroid isomerase-like protein
MTDSIDSFFAEWSAAERAGDTAKLDELLADDFVGIGPLGFSLPKTAWLARHGQGLRYDAFDVEELQVRTYGEVAIVTSRETQRGTAFGKSGFRRGRHCLRQERHPGALPRHWGKHRGEVRDSTGGRCKVARAAPNRTSTARSSSRSTSSKGPSPSLTGEPGSTPNPARHSRRMVLITRSQRAFARGAGPDF